MKSYFTKKEQIVILILVGVIVSVLGFKIISSKFISKGQRAEGIVVNTDNNSQSLPKDDTYGQKPSEVEQIEKIEDIVVHISGQVKSPGIVELPAGKRLIDAVELLGGLTIEADYDRINLAKKLQDEEKIYIPRIGEEIDFPLNETPQPVDSSLGNNEENNSEKIDINICTKEELSTLPGIGEALSTRIMEYREQNLFKSIEDIMNVSGIGAKKFEGMKDLIIVK